MSLSDHNQKDERSRAREIAEKLTKDIWEGHLVCLGHKRHEIYDQLMEALIQYGLEEREKAIRECAFLFEDGDSSSLGDYIKSKILSLIPQKELKK